MITEIVQALRAERDDLWALLERAVADVARLHAERDAARAALDALLAVEPLAPYSEYATGRPLTACVYCGVTAPRGTVPHPHDSDCPWARGREARGG